jgi:archaellum biogenesis ATPase FlaH
MFVLDKTAIDCFKQDGSIKAYKGLYGIDKITFDIDKGQKTDNQLSDLMKYFIETLTDMHVDKTCIQPWFSGRGFHVDIPNLYGISPSRETPQILSRTITKMFNGLTDNIYDRGRLIRLGYSFNKKSGLYKTPLTVGEIFNLNYKQIQEISSSFLREDYRPEPLPESEYIWADKLVEIEKKAQVIVTKEIKKVTLNSHVTCVQKMYAKGEIKGKRHQTLLRMISAWKRMGVPQAGGYVLAESWANTLPKKETDRMVDDIYKWNHNGYGCSDPVMEKFCDTLCKFYNHKDYGLKIMSPKDLTKVLKESLKREREGSSFDLKDLYNLPTPYRVHVGELVTMIGDTKIGKTAFIQNICVKLPRMKVLFLSLEVHASLIHRRNMQIAMNKTKEEINKIVEYGTDDEIQEIEDSVGNIHVTTTSPEIKSLKHIIAEHQPQIVVIDTIDAIRVNYMNDAFAKDQIVVNALKDIAQNLNVIIIAISHISKSASNMGVLNKHSAKGNSAIEQKSDKLIGITQYQVNSKARVIESIVARDENNFKLECWFNYETFRFVENG